MKLKTRLSLTFAFVVLLTVLLISLLANISINSEFNKYIEKQRLNRTQEIISGISGQYDEIGASWNVDFVHTIGMTALYDGYIVRVTDAQGQTLWDAEVCDMEACMQVMREITEIMTEHPHVNGEFVSEEFALTQGGMPIGAVRISYYGPYFFNENDFRFMQSLNSVIFAIGVFALILSAAAGLFISKRISDPVGKAAEAARRMSGGDYAARLEIKDNTKDLADLADSVNHLAQSLGHQEALRKQLTADVAHELRTPITSVQTHLEAMMEGLWEATPERLAGCHEEVMRIGALVKDLENLAKADNDKVELNKKPIDLAQVLERAVDSFEIDIRTKDLSVSISGSAPQVAADEDRMRQAAVNLLSNAVKYTPQKGRIDIILARVGDYAMFSVTDNGVGIPRDELPFIFERFYRADKSRNRKTGGSGIGLAIVKSIVEAHGGKVEAKSSLGEGSCFKVMLPI